MLTLPETKMGSRVAAGLCHAGASCFPALRQVYHLTCPCSGIASPHRAQRGGLSSGAINPVFRGDITGNIQFNMPAAHDRSRPSAPRSSPHQRTGIDAKPQTAFEFILKCTAAGHHESQEPIVRHAAGLLNVERLKG
jgi:hypothetical protein